jgi:hypothetical protein
MRTDLASAIKASLMRLNSGGSHNTAKFGVIVFENDASNGGEHNEPESPGRRNRTPVRLHYGTVFVTAGLKTGRPAGRNDEYWT